MRPQNHNEGDYEDLREVMLGSTYSYPLRTVKDALAFVREKPSTDGLIAARAEREEYLQHHPREFIDNGRGMDRIYWIVQRALNPFPD